MRRWRLLEAGAVLLLAIFAATLLHAPREIADLQFDCSAYTAQSIGLAEGRGNTIRLGDQVLPGFYPPAYPLSIAVVHRLAGEHPKNGVIASVACALATLLLVYALGRRVAGPAGGAAAFLILLGNELFGRVAHSVLTQSFALFGTAAMAHFAITRRAVLTAFAAGLVAGLSLLIRYQNFILAVALCLYAFVIAEGTWLRRCRAALPLWSGVAVGGAAVMAYCIVAYGSPLRTGYHFWAFPFGGSFSLDHLFHPRLTEGDDREPFLLLRCLIGLGPLYPLPVAALWLAGIAAAWWRRGSEPLLARASALTLVVNGVLFAVLGLYVFRSPKYAMLGLPLIAVMAGAGLVSWFRGRRLGPVPATCLPVLVAALFAIAPLRRSFAWGEGARPVLSREQVVVELADRTLESDAVVLGYADPILTNVLFVRETQRRYLYLNTGDTILPPLREQARAEIGGRDLTAAAVAGYVAARLAAGKSVYFLLSSPGNVDVLAAHELRSDLVRRFTFEATAVPEIEAIRP